MGESDEVRETWDERNGDDGLIVSGWSITVGELKKALEIVPDDYEVMITCSDVDDCDIAETHIDGLYPPALSSVGLFILHSGQTVSSEYAYHERMDAFHSTGSGVLNWSENAQKWYKIGERP